MLANILIALAAAGQAPAPPPPSGCTAPEHRQFDFWVGRWDVYDSASARKVGESLIERVYHGCGIRENWQPGSDGGGSLNIYLPAQRRWYQDWIDSNGSRGEFVGGWDGKAMVIEGDWPAPADPAHPRRERIRYLPQADGSVLQQGEVSLDRGKSWQPDFSFLYRRALGHTSP